MFSDVVTSSGRLWLKPRWCSSTVSGLFSFRIGGVSDSPFQSLNMGFHVGDNEGDVIANRKFCANQLGEELQSWVVSEQIHGSQVACVDETYCGSGAFEHESAIRGVDALITNVRHVTLAVLAADCVPVLLYDPVHAVIATAHSGWKGTFAHIVCKVVQTMHEEYGSNPKDIEISLGPSIRKCCYEVSDPVALPMVDAFGAKVAIRRFLKENHWFLGLQDCIILDLLSCRIEKRNIHDCGICTACHESILFSHRKSGGQTGRLVGSIALST